MVVSRRGGRGSRGVSSLFELKVELRMFNSQKKCLKRHIQQCSRPRDIGPCSRKINHTRHSLGVSVAKNTKCRISEPGRPTRHPL